METGYNPHCRGLTGYHPPRPFSAAVLGLRIYGRRFVRSSRIPDPIIPFRFEGNVVVVAWELDLNPVLCLQYRNKVRKGRNYRFLGAVDQEVNPHISRMFIFNKENVTEAVVGIGQSEQLKNSRRPKASLESLGGRRETTLVA